MRHLVISDLHIPDPDVDVARLDAFIKRFGDESVILAGDTWTSTRFLAEELVINGKWKYIRQWVTSGMGGILAGNHDRILRGCHTLGYLSITQYPWCEPGKLRQIITHCPPGVDAFWEDGGKLSRARRWIGNEILDRAWLWDRPGDNDAPGRIMRILDWCGRRLVPRGMRLDELTVARKAADWARLTGYDAVIMGHTHRMGLWPVVSEGRTVLVANTGSWLRGERSGVWDLDECRLYEWDGVDLVEWVEEVGA